MAHSTAVMAPDGADNEPLPAREGHPAAPVAHDNAYMAH